MVCAGNQYEYCGAGNRLNVYAKNGTVISTTSSLSSPASATGSTTTPTQTSAAIGIPVGWNYDGCYSEGINGRALNHQQPDSQTNSVENCINTCVGLGYSVAGLEFGAQCFCDNNLYNGAAPTAGTNCNMACSGNANELCGAGNYLSVYNTGNLTGKSLFFLFGNVSREVPLEPVSLLIFSLEICSQDMSLVQQLQIPPRRSNC
jgi:hypothetical protein